MAASFTTYLEICTRIYVVTKIGLPSTQCTAKKKF